MENEKQLIVQQMDFKKDFGVHPRNTLTSIRKCIRKHMNNLAKKNRLIWNPNTSLDYFYINNAIKSIGNLCITSTMPIKVEIILITVRDMQHNTFFIDYIPQVTYKDQKKYEGFSQINSLINEIEANPSEFNLTSNDSTQKITKEIQDLIKILIDVATQGFFLVFKKEV